MQTAPLPTDPTTELDPAHDPKGTSEMFTIDLPSASAHRPSFAVSTPAVSLDFDDPPSPSVVIGAADPLPRAKARCADGAGTLSALFFSEDLIDIARAKAICARCVLREPCLQQAVERGEAFGVWGGELLSGGQVVTHKRPRGRPPKHPRPQVPVDEVPLPDWAA